MGCIDKLFNVVRPSKAFRVIVADFVFVVPLGSKPFRILILIRIIGHLEA